MGQKTAFQFPFATYPAVRIMLLMICGITLAKVFVVDISIVLFISIFIFVGWFLFEFILKNRFVILATQVSTLFYLLFIIFSSATFISLQQERLLDEIAEAKPLEFYEWEDLDISGEIIEAGKSSSGRPVFTVDVRETTIPAESVWKEDYAIRLYGDRNANQKLSEGDIINAEIRVYEFPEQRNPYQFDYGKWLNSHGISAHGELQHVTQIKHSGILKWGQLRTAVLQNIDQLFDKKEASLAKALLLGYKDDLTPAAKQQFSRAGLSHIMAVSGLHVGFIVAPFWWIIPYLWGSKKGKWAGMIFLTVLLISYAGLTGFSASVCRASLMAWLLTYGRLFHKVRNSINLTAVAAIILLLIDPGQLFDPGFQLSFSAVFIILLVMPEVQRLFSQKYQFNKTGKFIAIILVSVVVQLGLFPILIQYFGEFSIAGPLSNALVIPLLTFVVPVGLLLVLIAPIIPNIFVWPIDGMLRWIESVAAFTGGSDFSFITMNEFSFTIFLIWLFATFLIASIRIPQIRWKMMICLLLALNVWMIEGIIKETEPKKLEVTFLDVGQGDAIHIKTPNNKHILVDTGRWSPAYNSGEDVIAPYLKEMGIDHLDAILLSHPHADHIGGVAEILNQVPVDVIYQSDVEYDSDLYDSYMKIATKKNIPVEYPQSGDMIQADPSVRIFVLGPEENAFSSNPNNYSLAVKVVYGNTSILFSGDAEKGQEELMANRYGDFLQSDIYKVGHHASNTSSTDSFMEFTDPDISVASLAFENRFGHPGASAVSRISRYSNVQNYTSLEGAVLYESDGKSFQQVDWKNE